MGSGHVPNRVKQPYRQEHEYAKREGDNGHEEQEGNDWKQEEDRCTEPIPCRPAARGGRDRR